MKLLHWCTLSPEGPSNLAAIRFAKLIRISSIRVFPKGSKPFQNCPDIVGETEPESFFLDVYFNAQPINQPSPDSKEKQRAANALVPTTIAYAGGQVDFTVDLGTEYGTRLMIVKGQFDTLSLAIYGHVVSESDQPSQSIEEIANSVPKPAPSVEARTLPSSIDPANSTDPTLLARNLLSLLDDAPPLSLITKLMFCLKPDNDDWDDPDFPYLFVDFEKEIFHNNNISNKVDGDISQDEDEEDGDSGEFNFDFDATLDAMSRLVSDAEPEETLSRFAQVVADNVGSRTNSQAFQVAKLFKLAASQRPSLALALCQAIEPNNVFDAQSFDEDTLLNLLDASANADIARFLNTDTFLTTLTEFQSSTNPVQTTPAKQVAQRLDARLRAWDIFEDALLNTMADFTAATAMLRDIGSGEQSLGSFLASMTGHEDLVTKLAENPTFAKAISGVQTGLLVKGRGSSPVGAMSHDGFIAFVRAFIGVASVLVVWAWSDSLGNDVCRERALGMIRLWQNADGYRDIVNYLLLLRQFTLRLKWITTNDSAPRKSGIFGEQILSDLFEEPQAALNDDLVQTILSLQQPLSYINENDRLSMRKIALVVEDGLPAAIEELTLPSSHPLSHRRIRTLRVSVALVERELTNDALKGDWKVLQTIWNEHSMALVPRLADLLAEVAQDLNGQFLLNSPFLVQQQQSQSNQPVPRVLSQLFSLAEEIIGLLLHLVLVPTQSSSSSSASGGTAPALSLSFPLSSYALRSLIRNLADMFACTDMADTIYSPGTPVCISAQSARQTCLEFIQRATVKGPGGIIIEPARGKSGAEITMNILLKHGLMSSGRDPVYHLLQMFTLIDHVLPESTNSSLANRVKEDNDAEREDAWEVEKEKQKEFWVTEVLPNVLDEAQEFFRQLDVENKVHFLRRLVRLDSKNLVGMAEWMLTEELKLLERCGNTLLSMVDPGLNQADTGTQEVVVLYQIGLYIRLMGHMLQGGSDMLDWCIGVLKTVPQALAHLVTSLEDLLAARVESPHIDKVVEALLLRCDEALEDKENGDKFKFLLVICSLRASQRHRDGFNPGMWMRILTVLKGLSPGAIDLSALRLALGEALAVIQGVDILSPDSSSICLSLLEWIIAQPSDSRLAILCGIKVETLTSFYDTLSIALPQDQASALDNVRSKISVDEDETIVPVNMKVPDTLQLSIQELQDILSPPSAQVMPSTPTRNNTPDALGLIISPPATLLRSPAATGLTKTYLNNDFRELRQATVARQNTSRLPSMHST
ncbi:hypothetical protein D9757_001211 [Collybiopsis confluens]|uniref:Virilizer N-terminal domain-containing protein n=1 Tax=Collybiopsis confluens TaxID=2823264 RepID=A0A8H5MG94_9AGAR|nr:hypothetical protein D9757_001211 [Collybiopsis confluens]